MDNKKKVAAAVAATIAASGAAVDASFDNPADILQQDIKKEPQVQYVDLENDQGVQDEDKNRQEEPQKAGALQQWILHLPLAVRALVVLPLWFAGHLLIMGGSMLLTGLSPIMHWLLGFVLIAAVIAGAFTVAAKAMFPDLPLKKILNRHSAKWILICAAGVWLADIVLGVCWNDYEQYKSLFLACFTLAAIGGIVIWFARREHRRRLKLEAKAAAKAAEAAAQEDMVYTSLGQTFSIRPPRE